MSFLASFKAKAKQLKLEVYALWLASHHPRTPWYAKAWCAVVIGYALSPLDLIPDFIPILGLLDDLVLVPAGIALALRMIPKAVMEECRAKAGESMHASLRSNWVAATIIVILWLLLIFWLLFGVFNLFG